MDPVTMSIMSTLPAVLSEASTASGIGTAVAGASGAGVVGSGFLDNILSYGKSAFNGLNDFLGTNIGSSFGSMAMNTGIGAISSAMNYHYNKKLQDRAFAHQIKMYKNQNQWRVQDLRKAGLNPILATHGGSSMPSAPMGNVSTAMGQHDLSQTFLNLQGFKNQKDFRRYARESHDINLAKSEAELLNILRQGDLITAQANSLDASTALQNFEFSRKIRKWDQMFEDLKKMDVFAKSDSIFGGLMKDFLINPVVGLLGLYKQPSPVNYDDDGRPSTSAYKVYKTNWGTRYKPKFHKFD